MGSFSVEVLVLSRAAKMCPDRPQALTKARNNQAFPVVNIGRFSHLFLSDPVPDTSRHACKNNRVNIRRVDCVGPGQPSQS